MEIGDFGTFACESVSISLWKQDAASLGLELSLVQKSVFYAASRARGEICEKAAIDLCETPRHCRSHARA
jgi:hypothetical protein